MGTILISGILLSVFHAMIPSHWLPVLAVGKRENWTPAYILYITFLAGLAHVLSTVLLGIGLAAEAFIFLDPGRASPTGQRPFYW